MLAIARALLTNPTLLIMDEPSEGLAPAIIEHLVETFKKLEQEGLSILLIEQNLGVATSLAERQLVMVAGSIYAETTATRAVAGPGAAAPLPRRRAAGGACVVATRRPARHARHEGRTSTRSCATGSASTASTCSSSTRASTSRSARAGRLARRGRERRRRGRRRACGGRRSRRSGDRDGGGRGGGREASCYADGKLDGHPRARRLGRLVDRDARDARAAGRRAEADGLDGRVRRHAARTSAPST